MQTPQRKPGKYTGIIPDQHITIERHDKLVKELAKLKQHVRPPAIEEVKRLALMGDFSENAAYQIAKGRLRGINQRILDIEKLLKRSEIIDTYKKHERVELGCEVLIRIGDKESRYRILGSTETDPLRGIISHNSPIGKALLGKRVGEGFSYLVRERKVEGVILEIR